MARRTAQSGSHSDLSIRRTLFVAAFVVFWMLAISARLVYLQVSRHESLVDRAQRQQQSAIETAPARGLLLDRQGRELARSIDTTSIAFDPGDFDPKPLKKGESEPTVAVKTEKLQCAAGLLSSVLKSDTKALFNQMNEAKEKGRRFLWIARRIELDRAREIEALQLPGIRLIKEPKRYYPNGSLAAHVLGFVGLDGTGPRRH